MSRSSTNQMGGSSDEDRLSDAHASMLLEESGIKREIAEARGYRTVRTKAELKLLGFTDTQRNVPALLCPVYSPRGEISTYQIRPDRPRINKEGKPVRYETPGGSQMAFDVHPSMRDKLDDPSVPLFVTEGVKKGDALTGEGLCAVALLGVWNFRGTNSKGGKTILPEWEYVALERRQVYVVFDSDIMLKPDVYKAMLRIKSFLEFRKAKVAVIYLPAGAHGVKQGVDDFLVAGHNVDDLFKLATTELREPPQGDDEEEPATQYRATADGLVWDKRTQHDTIATPLTNFVARIVSDVAEDDGAEVKRVYEIEATVRGRTKRFDVPADAFASMQWVSEHLGAGAIVHPGWGVQDRARAAIQVLSEDVAERQVFTHTGWRDLDGAWVFMHGGGVIGPADAADGVEVRLDDAHCEGAASYGLVNYTCRPPRQVSLLETPSSLQLHTV
jgi:hypothetical protein